MPYSALVSIDRPLLAAAHVAGYFSCIVRAWAETPTIREAYDALLHELLAKEETLRARPPAPSILPHCAGTAARPLCLQCCACMVHARGRPQGLDAACPQAGRKVRPQGLLAFSALLKKTAGVHIVDLDARELDSLREAVANATFNKPISALKWADMLHAAGECTSRACGIVAVKQRGLGGP